MLNAINSFFIGMLFLIFLTLKLCQIIDWSWWWVCAPIWIPVALCLILLVVLGCITMYEASIEKKI